MGKNKNKWNSQCRNMHKKVTKKILSTESLQAAGFMELYYDYHCCSRSCSNGDKAQGNACLPLNMWVSSAVCVKLLSYGRQQSDNLQQTFRFHFPFIHSQCWAHFEQYSAHPVQWEGEKNLMKFQTNQKHERDYCGEKQAAYN